MFLFCLVFAMFCARLFICASWSPAGKGLASWLSFVVSSVSLSLSHWYPGSGVVLDCIDSWSLQPYLLSDPPSYLGPIGWTHKWVFVHVPPRKNLHMRTRCNSYNMGCPPVRGDNPRALASGLSYVQVYKHGITILYHIHQCRPCTSWDISC